MIIVSRASANRIAERGTILITFRMATFSEAKPELDCKAVVDFQYMQRIVPKSILFSF